MKSWFLTQIRRMMGKTQLYFFILRYKWWYLLVLIAFIVGIAGTFSNPSFWILAVVSGVLEVILFVRDTKELRRSDADLYVTSVNTIILKSLTNSDTYVDYELIEFHRYYALYCHRVNRLLTTSILRYELEPEKFALNTTVRPIATFALQNAFKSGAIIFNSPKVRLKSDLITIKNEFGNDVLMPSKVSLQETDYFSGLCTNEMTCKEVWSRSSNNKIYDGISMMSNNRIILDLSESICSNHIGISTLAFTSDGKIIITTQTGDSAQSANLLAPSGSGSADFKDLENKTITFHDFITNAMERELLEECGLDENMNGFVNSHVIGFARLLHRGGKPEFFGVSFVNKSSDLLKVTDKEAMFITNIDRIKVNRTEIGELRNNLARFQEEREIAFSFLLYLNFRFLEDYLNSSPESFFELISS